MTEIERILNDSMALRNISDADPLHHNDNKCRHQFVILFKVINDAAPCYLLPEAHTPEKKVNIKNLQFTQGLFKFFLSIIPPN